MLLFTLMMLLAPQDARGVPVYNPSGKYLIKLWVNGVLRKVTTQQITDIWRHCFVSEHNLMHLTTATCRALPTPGLQKMRARVVSSVHAVTTLVLWRLCLYARVQVTVDDTLPVGANGRLLCSATSAPGELWVSIIEKAYMKVNGASKVVWLVHH
jgi:Calpain family cysteine protease